MVSGNWDSTSTTSEAEGEGGAFEGLVVLVVLVEVGVGGEEGKMILAM